MFKTNKTALVFAMLILFNWAQAYTIEQQHSVHFDKNSYSLNSSQTEALARFIGTCDLSLEHRFIMQGHTDSDGSIAYNRELSEQRLGAVRTFLNLEFALSAIEGSAHSELLPVASNESPKGMALNRRVTLIYKADYFENIAVVDELLKEESISQYRIDASKDEILLGAKGVRVFVPAGSLVTEEGKLVENVEVHLTESLDPMSFIAHNLETQSAKGILESGGMIKLEAYSESGESLVIKDGQELLLSIPDKEREEGMQTFRTEDDGSTWVADEPILEPELGIKHRPVRPRIDIAAFKPPRFVLDKTKMPLYPAEPTLLDEPVLPMREDFNKGFSLAYAFQKKKRLAEEEAKFNYAMRVYNKRLKRYDRRIAKYELRCEAYSEVLNEYLASLPAWEAEMSRQMDEYRAVTLIKAKKEYDAEVARIQSEHSDAIFHYENSLDKWTEDYIEAIDKLGIPEGESIDKYVFKATQLGWVNIDRFTKYKAEDKHEIVAYVLEASETPSKVFVVLNDGRSMLQLRARDGRYALGEFPKDELGELLSYRVKDGKLELFNELFVGKNEFEIDYRPSSISELRSILKANGTSLGSL